MDQETNVGVNVKVNRSLLLRFPPCRWPKVRQARQAGLEVVLFNHENHVSGSDVDNKRAFYNDIFHKKQELKN